MLHRQRQHIAGCRLGGPLLLAVCLCAVWQPARLTADDKPSATDQPPRGSSESDGMTLFRKEVAPVLSARCFECHGGDFRKAGLDISTRESLLIGGDEGPAIIPGNAKGSLLHQVVTHEREPYMPKKADKLDAAVIAKIAEWIDAGAPYAGPITPNVQPVEAEPANPENQPKPDGEPPAKSDVQPKPDEQATPAISSTGSGSDHWSFTASKRPEVPQPESTDWVRNPIDAFVLAGLRANGVQPSPEADRHTLIRRLSLDLLGLPPDADDVEAFVKDTSPDAYDKLVDRLLASPHFGERWARHWLDLARYADSDGFEKDTGRPFAWRYRDWVIEAINRDLPFDQFTTEQLAGDLLPDPDVEELVATGFHRNTLTNREGGVDAEQFRVESIVDRVNTTGTVWLGLTVGCAQCHSHKYDPITQREYYSLFAFFNQADERDVPAPLPEQMPQYRREVDAFKQVHGKLTDVLAAYDQHELPGALERWEQNLFLPEPYWKPLAPSFAVSANGATITVMPDHSLLVSGKSLPTDRTIVTLHTQLEGITALRLEVLPHESLGSKGPGRGPNGNFVLSELSVQMATADNPADLQPVALQNASASHEQPEWPVKAAIDGDPKTGWGILPQNAKRNAAVFETKQDISRKSGNLLILTLEQSFGGEHTLGRFRISTTTAKRPIRASGIPDDIAHVILTAKDKRDDDQKNRLLDYYRSIDPGRANLQKAIDEHAAGSPDTRAVKAQTLAGTASPRPTHVLTRGDFLRPGAEVSPNVPAVLPPLKPRNGHADRLDLARWLMAEENPLTARVAVNRIWMYLFGTGLVATPEDFGTRGELPSHPELLDWLATEYRQRGWSRKTIIKLIVTSATYRQSSNTRPELIDRDPSNRWLARQYRYRLSAEIIRDLNLAVGDLLYDRIGGPSVRPPQPAGIAELTYADSVKWFTSPAPDRYRRGLYIWFQRTSPYPMLTTFDAPDSNVTCPQRRRSDTPLQALTLLNDPVFVECAQHLGKRIAEELEGELDDRIRQAWSLCLSRPPTEVEMKRLVQLHAEMIESYRKDHKAASELLGGMEVPDDRRIETAAWVAVGRVLLNLDEFITRG